MKAEELTVGSYVIANPDEDVDPGCGTFIGRITSIYYDEGVLSVLLDNYDYPVAFGLLNPVPLTAEILEKNGIKYQWGIPWYQGGYNEEGFEIHFALYCQVNLRYVHQLQNMLRVLECHKEIIL